MQSGPDMRVAVTQAPGPNGKWQHPRACGYVKSLGLVRVATHVQSVCSPLSENDGLLCVRDSHLVSCWDLCLTKVKILLFTFFVACKQLGKDRKSKGCSNCG